MTALLGKGCLFLGCLFLGFDRAKALRRRRRLLEDFRRALGEITRELGFSLRPLAQLLTAQGEGRGPASGFFSSCCRHFRTQGRESWRESWHAALEETTLPLTPEDKALLEEGGEILGRYDGGRQTEALKTLLARLDRSIGEAREEEGRLTKVYLALGVTAGLFCCILL